MPLTVASSLSVTSVDWSGWTPFCWIWTGPSSIWLSIIIFGAPSFPREWGLKRGLDTNTSQQRLAPVFANEQGKLNWYCLDFGATHWSLISRPSRLSTPTASAGDPGRNFLRQLQASHLDVVLITNAHP
ncbi:MAG: hypothetical protein CM15mP89_2480 [Gammaproteobacteria bacterium]|nr:MAG: hypothetical protein CM15mP89_2480 [Gammaproteobacteria bacterium]